MGKHLTFCNYADIHETVGLSSINNVNDPYIETHETWAKVLDEYQVTGFLTSCTVLEAVRNSQLDCLYDIDCLKFMLNYFPDLNQTRRNWTNDILSEKMIPLNNLLSNLFISNWSIEINDLTYFNKCSPLHCTYTKTYQMNSSYTTTLFISIYGGLIIVLRFITMFLIKIILEFRNRPLQRMQHISAQNTIKQKLIRSLRVLNLFKDPNARAENDVKQQRTITFVYIILLTGSLLIILLFTSFHHEMMIITEEKPSLVRYSELQNLYSRTLKCSCFTMATPYSVIVSLVPTFHRVCQSDFVDKRWIEVLKIIKHPYVSLDWRNIALSQFQFLSDLCKLANEIVKDAIDRFMMEPLISSNLLSEIEFFTQFNQTLIQFFHSTKFNFIRLSDVGQLLENVDQPYMTPGNLILPFHSNLIAESVPNETNDTKLLNFIFRFAQHNDTNSTFADCVCIINPRCETLASIYNYDYNSNADSTYEVSYSLPGWKQSCSQLNSLTSSTLECLYSTNCLTLLVRSVKTLFILSSPQIDWFEPRFLIYNSTIDRFYPNTLIKDVLDEIMVENWNSSISYKNLYENCAPTHCTYAKRIRTKNFFEAITLLISMIGSVIIGVRLGASVSVKLVFHLWKRICKKQTEGQEQRQDEPADAVHLKLFDRLKTKIGKVLSSLFGFLLNLNIFLVRDFNSNSSRVTVQNLGRWSTRLYISIFLLINIIFIFYNVTQSKSITKTFDQPQFNQYHHLIKIYGKKFKCSCSNIASKYETFVQIQPEYHEICKRQVVFDEWQMNLTKNHLSDIFLWKKNDYRLFLLAHIKYLQGLCSNSIEIIQNLVDQFHSTLLITAQLLEEKDFHSHINNFIEQTKSKAPHLLLNILSLIRIIYHGNAFISKYQSNYKYIFPWNHFDKVYVPTEAMIYDQNCTCGLISTCTTQAGFYNEKNSSDFIRIQGLKMGCLPSESFLQSTLQCFFNQTCLNLIQQYSNSSHFNISSLSYPKNESLINKTIHELINDLFVESWSKNINYSLYFNQCLPSLCSYTYNKRFDLFELITFLLGFQGGLKIVLKWICPQIIQILMKIYSSRKKRSNRIDSQDSTTATRDKTKPLIRNIQCSFKFINVCFVFIFLTIFIIHFSIFLTFKISSSNVMINQNMITTEYQSIMTTTTTMIDTITSTEVLHCPISAVTIQLKTSTCSQAYALISADLNDDSRSELLFYCESTGSIHILISSDDELFKTEKIHPLEHDHQLFSMTWGDINNDGHIDLIGLDTPKNELRILFGDGNLTFKQVNTLPLSSGHRRTLMLIDLNNDSYLDIISRNEENYVIRVFLGDGTEKFFQHTVLYCEKNSWPSSLAINDLNHDGSLDIIITLRRANDIVVYLGDNNLKFNQSFIFSPGYDSEPDDLFLADLNNDTHSDIVFSYQDTIVAIMYGFGNGTFSTLKKYMINNSQKATPMAVIDFNCDGYLDIILGNVFSYDIVALMGSKNGYFQYRSIGNHESFKPGSSQYSTMTTIFNDNGHKNIVVLNSRPTDAIILLNTCQCCSIDINNFTSH
ncbi:unnamed protein product [Adineta ricciae]|uniref:Uncharacterized protein n=1 Tax=Adineta ricciae TaxID=249248 RepID=A0A815TWW4_ADIRI|nr:unnamed protein product [Adineta ricciae]